MSDRPTDPSGDDELSELRALARRHGVEAGATPEQLEPAPAAVWDRIASELAEPVEPAPVAAIRPAARRRWIAPLAVAAGIAVVAGVVVLGGDDEPEPTVVATAALDSLGASGSGSAELLDTDGHLQLRVETDDLDPGDGFLEVWVIDTAVERLVSLGPVRADGLYDLPPGLDPEAFPIVDVSVEPIDGDPTHSGDSVLRGQLERV